MADANSCVHETLNSAHLITLRDDSDAMADLDQLAACLTEHMEDLHVDPSDPQVLEAVVAGFSIVLTRVKSWAEHGLFTPEQDDVISVMIGQLTQSVALLYAASPAPSGSDLDTEFGFTPAAPPAPAAPAAP